MKLNNALLIYNAAQVIGSAWLVYEVRPKTKHLLQRTSLRYFMVYFWFPGFRCCVVTL